MKTGRPPLYNERMVPYYVGLPPSMAREITEYGDGNLARGVRKVWLEYTARRKVEQTKEWMRWWRSNPTASSDPPYEVIVEPGQEMLPPPSDPTTEETALGADALRTLDDPLRPPADPHEEIGITLEELAAQPIVAEVVDPREDSGAIEAATQSGYWFKSQGTGDM